MRRRRSMAAALLGASLLSACAAGNGGPDISEARIGQPTGPNAALYLTVTSKGAGDRLIGASTSVAPRVELHETKTDSDGTMSMVPIDGLDLGPEETLVLEPGGYHMMLVDVDRLEIGDTVEVTLIWEDAGEITVEAEVVDPAETISHDH